MPKSVLVDLTRCIGCRGCQVACKSWNEMSVVKTAVTGSFENPPAMSEHCYTRIRFEEGEAGGHAGLELRQGAVPALQGAGLRLGLPGRGPGQDRERGGRLRFRQVHRLPLLHGGLPVRDPEVRVEQGPAALGEEVHLLRRAPGRRPAAGLRQDLPDRRAALRRGRGGAGRGEEAARHRQVRAAHLRREGGRRHRVDLHRRPAVRRTRFQHARCRSRRCRRTPGRRSRRSRWRSWASSAVLGGLAWIRNRGPKGGE